MALINTTTTGVLGSTFFADGTGDLTIQQNGVLVNKITSTGLTIHRPGTVLQTVANTTITSSTSANAVVLTLSITPSSTSSRILLLGALEGERVGGSAGNYIFGQLRKNTTNLRSFINAAGYQQTTGARNFNTLMFIDSPATTSAITYDIFCDHTITGAASGVNFGWYMATIHALEIAS